MSFLDLAKNRYSTKKYNPNKKVSSEQIEKLREIIRLSPSSINSQPWKFLFIENEEIKNKLAEVSFHNTQKIKEASLLVVFTAIDDINVFEKQLYENLSQGHIDYYNQKMKNKDINEIKLWFNNQIYISLGFFLSACADLGLDSTAMEGIEKDKYNEILNLKGYKTIVAVAVGYRDEEDFNQPNLNPKLRLSKEDVTEII
ncbi:nitroreductase family protein [Chishuiella sp.]|uniref:nitroreductase family protein n=1 Tax=Chishuiella sp. TaxID=1969467 RepID=UPI0028B1109C|nr:nitroreductase family protein [Chishuiella sp.]